MALWLLCCVLLFVTSRGYVWLSHQSWFLAPELSLPWLVLGGLGLAIASNRQAWLQTVGKLPPQFSNPTRANPVQASATPPPRLEKSPADTPVVSPVASQTTAKTQASISFDIPAAKSPAHRPVSDGGSR